MNLAQRGLAAKFPNRAFAGLAERDLFSPLLVQNVARESAPTGKRHRDKDKTWYQAGLKGRGSAEWRERREKE